MFCVHTVHHQRGALGVHVERPLAGGNVEVVVVGKGQLGAQVVVGNGGAVAALPVVPLVLEAEFAGLGKFDFGCPAFIAGGHGRLAPVVERGADCHAGLLVDGELHVVAYGQCAHAACGHREVLGGVFTVERHVGVPSAVDAVSCFIGCAAQPCGDAAVLLLDNLELNVVGQGDVGQLVAACGLLGELVILIIGNPVVALHVEAAHQIIVGHGLGLNLDKFQRHKLEIVIFTADSIDIICLR